MSRSSWKYTWVTEADLRFMYSRLSFTNEVYNIPSRHKSINMLNIDKEYHIHQGIVDVALEVDINYLDKKLGMFAKTRKPFFFRSKKKKR